MQYIKMSLDIAEHRHDKKNPMKTKFFMIFNVNKPV